VDIYTERANLLAYLATQFPAAIAFNDPDEPDWAVLYLETPRGQMSWHLAPWDLGLFSGHVHVMDSEEIVWDGHTTEEKYGRLRLLVADLVED
jgi:hypothetical protein